MSNREPKMELNVYEAALVSGQLQGVAWTVEHFDVMTEPQKTAMIELLNEAADFLKPRGGSDED